MGWRPARRPDQGRGAQRHRTGHRGAGLIRIRSYVESCRPRAPWPRRSTSCAASPTPVFPRWTTRTGWPWPRQPGRRRTVASRPATTPISSAVLAALDPRGAAAAHLALLQGARHRTDPGHPRENSDLLSPATLEAMAAHHPGLQPPHSARPGPRAAAARCPHPRPHRVVHRAGRGRCGHPDACDTRSRGGRRAGDASARACLTRPPPARPPPVSPTKRKKPRSTGLSRHSRR